MDVDSGDEAEGAGPPASGGLPAPPDEVEEALAPLWHVLLRCFGRTPTPAEMATFARKLERGAPAAAFLAQLVASPRFREHRVVRAKNPPGHYFSPVVDPDAVRDYVAAARRARPADIGGVTLDLDAMEAFWRANAANLASVPFTEAPDPARRYFYAGGPYKQGDAITLRMMVHHFRPRRVVEIGSGYSSACTLDSAEEAGLDPFALTCIEPYPTRLRSILRPGDEGGRLTLLERGVQGVDLDLFRTLEAGDILFIDSTHVVKTGSDVHYELFHILPVLRPGVVVHFHDVRWPFEYSDRQIFEKNYSWNEAYVVRALLMHSTRFRVLFSGSLLAAERRELVQAGCPAFLRNPGSALWLTVLDDGR